MLCRYTQVYQQDAPPLPLCLHPSLCRAGVGAPDSQSLGKPYFMQATPGQAGSSFVSNNLMVPGLPAGHLAHTLATHCQSHTTALCHLACLVLNG